MARHNPASGTTAAGFEAPERVVENLQTSTRPPFHGTIGGRTYLSSAASMGGQFMLGVSAGVLNSAGVIAPDKVEGDKGFRHNCSHFPCYKPKLLNYLNVSARLGHFVLPGLVVCKCCASAIVWCRS